MAYCQPKTLNRARHLRKQMTNAETILWSRLRCGAHGGFRFRKQHPIGPYIADFACVSAQLIIEVDGETHGSDAQVRYDQRRSAYMKARGWHILRVTNEEVYQHLNMVLDAIAQTLEGKLKPPSVAARPLPPRSSFGAEMSPPAGAEKWGEPQRKLRGFLFEGCSAFSAPTRRAKAA
jgi:Uncharacterized protein conserved in bacteria